MIYEAHLHKKRYEYDLLNNNDCLRFGFNSVQVPFLDPTTTLLHPILPLTPVDYEEFGYPFDVEDFEAIQKYSPYNNIRNDAVYPAVLITSSFSTRWLFNLINPPPQKIPILLSFLFIQYLKNWVMSMRHGAVSFQQREVEAQCVC